MIVRIIRSHRDIVLICDDDLIGKKFEEGQFQLDIKENFFQGDKKTEQETTELIEKMVKEDATFNIIGKSSVNLASKIGLINKGAVKAIQGIPFAMVLA